VNEFVCIKLLGINEDIADKKIMNCTNATKLKKIGKCFFPKLDANGKTK
jgi:hypothetical protein